MVRVEAVLFLSDEPINTRKISLLANLADGTEARTLIRRLNEQYDRNGSAFRAEEVAGGFQLLTRRKFAGWLRRLVRTHVETRLSAPALETLAVAAYRQPVTRVEIEAIRGVQCDEMLRQLMERDLLKIVGRSDDLGRPFLYGTTRRFLQLFGLRHLDELPQSAALRAGRSADEAGSATDQQDVSNVSLEESEVKIAVDPELAREEDLKRRRWARTDEVRAEDDDDDFEEEEDEEDDDDEDEDDDKEEEDEEFDDDDFDDDWEEVDDEEDEDEEEEEDEDWDDDEEDDDDEWDDDDEEEEEEDDE
jgi:segregation and condensation protein B